MNDQLTTQVESEVSGRTSPLVERMDSSIGEMTTVMGAMFSEFFRRTLRGGVMHIGDELHDFVAEKVDATVADRLPSIEQAAADAAENTARVAATEVAHEEVKALEQRTQETDRDLAAQIEETARTAQRNTIEKARELGSKIEETHKRVGVVQVEISHQVQEILERTRKGTAHFTERLTALESYAADLGKKHHHEIDERKADQTAVKAEFQRLAQELEDNRTRFQKQLKELLQTNQQLGARLAELEKPRGLRAWLGRLFRRRKS